jgi:hypothetical protein
VNKVLWPVLPDEGPLTVVLIHKNTPDDLALAVSLYRLQTLQVFISIIDIGSEHAVVRTIEDLRSSDLEIHYLRGHHWEHPADPVAVAMDLAFARNARPYMFVARADAFPRRLSMLKELFTRVNETTPVLGARFTSKQPSFDDREWMVSYNGLMLYLPPLRAGKVMWRLQDARIVGDKPLTRDEDGPEAENHFNYDLALAGISPIFATVEPDEGRSPAGHYLDFVRIPGACSGPRAMPPLDKGAQEMIDQQLAEVRSEAQKRLLDAGGRLPLRAGIEDPRQIGALMVPDQCQCTEQFSKTGICPYFRQPMRGRLWEICQGKECTDRFRRRYLRTLANVAAPVYQMRDCSYLGEQVGTQATSSCLGTRVPLMACKHKAHITTTAKKCEICPDFCPQWRGREIKAGVVIGSYNMPSLIELQIKLVRHRCGPVPILISDDHSDGIGSNDPATPFEMLRTIAESYENVHLWTNGQREGHAHGDYLAMVKGIIWGRVCGFDVVAKLSQRFMIDSQWWLQDGAFELLQSGKPLASNIDPIFPVRTDALILDVKQWLRPDVLQRIQEERAKSPAENFFSWLLRQLKFEFHHWDLIGSNRFQWAPHLYWYVHNSRADYEALAARYGLTIGPDWLTRNWWDDQGYKA